MSALNLPHVGEWSRLLHWLHRDGFFFFVCVRSLGKIGVPLMMSQSSDF